MDKEATLEAVETTLDAVEDKIDAAVEIADDAISWIQRPATVKSLIAVASFSAGIGVSYFILRSRIRKHYETIAEEEIAVARNRYKILPDDPGKEESPQDFVERKYGGIDRDAIEAQVEETAEGFIDAPEKVTVTADNGTSFTVEATQEEIRGVTAPQRQSIWDNPGSVVEFDYEVEIPQRTPDEPYIITIEEFMESRDGFEQGNCTYFENDDTLVDSRDEKIDDADRMVGDQNLLRFGYGSKDRNVVYVRNERLSMDFEIALSKGSYTEEVLGITHDDGDDLPGVRKFRQHYE